MSMTRKSGEVAAHDVTHEKEYAEVVRLAQTFNTLMDVLWV